MAWVFTMQTPKTAYPISEAHQSLWIYEGLSELVYNVFTDVKCILIWVFLFFIVVYPTI